MRRSLIGDRAASASIVLCAAGCGAACRLVLGVAAWVAVLESGVDPVIVGLALGPLTSRLPRAARRPRAGDASCSARSASSRPPSWRARRSSGWRPRSRRTSGCSTLLHPWTSFVIVPLFAVANAGIARRRSFLRRAATSPITIGIVVGYVVGKPLGIIAAPWLAVAARPGRLRPPVGWPALAGGGAVAGIGFTVALLIAGLAFTGEQLEEAKAGVLAAAACAACSPGSCSGSSTGCPAELRARQLAARPRRSWTCPRRSTPSATTSAAPATRRSRWSSTATSSARSAARPRPSIRDLLAEFGDDLRYVWRHLPLADVHPRAQLAAEAAEAAAAQGAFWPMYDVLLDAPGRAARRRPRRARARARPRHRPLHRRPAPPRLRGARRRGRRRRRPQRRLRHADASSSTASATTAPTTSRR